MRNKHKRKKTKEYCFNFKKFVGMYRQYIVVCYIFVLYILIFLYDFAFGLEGNHFSKIINPIFILTTFYVISAIFTVIIYLFTYYHLKKDIINGICFRVLEKCQIKEQYKRFIEIKKCIETYKNEHGKCEIKTNVNVIAASIAYDSAKCIVYPILLTAIAFVIPDSDNLMLIRIMLGLPMIYALLLFAHGISRNAFIKKVIECISDEQAFNKMQ